MIDLVVAAMIVAFALIAVHVSDLVRMAIAFSAMSLMIAVSFYLLGSAYASAFQIAINAGAVTILFLAMIHVMKRRRLD
ncbi:MAG: hypothetical protein H5T32_02450 [Candidatus Methanosuratus sp.]|nr:hypothetical protein [Candidatus Methanosuratincola sp.]